MLDFGALEVALTTIDAVGNAGAEQGMFEHTRLRIGAIQQRNLTAQPTLGNQIFDLFDNPLRFLQIAAGLKHAHLFTLSGIGAQVLAQAFAVVGNEHVGRIQNVAMRAVVLLQLDQILYAEFTFEGGHVADIGAAKRINALVIIAHREDRTAVDLSLSRQQLEPVVLKIIGVLKLIDQNVFETLLIMLAQRLIAYQQLIAAQQQLGEIDHTIALALLIVEIIELDEFTVVIIAGVDILGAQTLILGAIDEVHQIARRILFIIDIHRLEQTLDGRQLILRIENLEGLRQARIAIMRAQQPVTQTMKGAHPHAARVDRHHRRQPRQHFLGRLIGKGHRQDARWRDLAGLDQPGDASSQDTGFAGTGTGQNQGRLGWQGYSSELLFVEIVEKILHLAIIRLYACTGASSCCNAIGSWPQNPSPASLFQQE